MIILTARVACAISSLSGAQYRYHWFVFYHAVAHDHGYHQRLRDPSAHIIKFH